MNYLNFEIVLSIGSQTISITLKLNILWELLMQNYQTNGMLRIPTHWHISSFISMRKFWKKMVENSNIYHGYCIQIRRICHPNSRDKDWSDIDLNEFKAFLGVSILMGIIKVPHYWYLSFKLKYLFILLQLVLYIYMWHHAEHPALWVYCCRVTHIFLRPLWAVLGRCASDTACPKRVILFANATSLNDAVTSYVMSQCCMCIGHMTIYYKKAANTLVGGSCLLFVCLSGSTLSPETCVWLVSNTCRSPRI